MAALDATARRGTFPTDVEANWEHMHSFDAVIMEGTDHFLHMAVPDAFNPQVEAVIAGMLPRTPAASAAARQ